MLTNSAKYAIIVTQAKGLVSQLLYLRNNSKYFYNRYCIFVKI